MKMQLKSQAAVLAAVIIGTLIFPATLHGQAQLSGSYVFIEEGLATTTQRIAALARLTFAPDGTLVGRQMALAGNSVDVSDVQGTYSFEADGMGTMVLSVSGRLAVPNLDSAGPVTGFEMVSTVSGITRTSVTGLQTIQPDGFRSLVLSAEIPGDGEDAAPATLRENYAILSTTAELKAVRLDSGAVSIVTLTR